MSDYKVRSDAPFEKDYLSGKYGATPVIGNLESVLRRAIERTLKRTSSLKLVKQTFLIVCEGEVTEPEYFNSFRLTSANVKAIGKGMNTVSLVKEAIAIRDIEKRRSRNYDQCWVVFDKDDFSDGDFNTAIQMAQANGFQVAYSNQAFEYWFLLHFNLYQGSIHRSRYGYTEAATVRCLPICLVSDTVRQKGTP